MKAIHAHHTLLHHGVACGPHLRAHGHGLHARGHDRVLHPLYAHDHGRGLHLLYVHARGHGHVIPAYPLQLPLPLH